MFRLTCHSTLFILLALQCVYAENPRYGWMNTRDEAEYLAVETTGSLAPSELLADQIENDLAAIRIAFPSFADIRVFPDWVPGEVVVDMTREAFESVKDHTFLGFDGLFQLLGTPTVELQGDHPLLTPGLYLHWDEVYHGDRLAELFGNVPGVIGAWSNWTIGDGDDIVTNLDRTYRLSRGYGDCFVHCDLREEWLFTVTDQGAYLGTPPVPEPCSFIHYTWILVALFVRRSTSAASLGLSIRE